MNSEKESEVENGGICGLVRNIARGEEAPPVPFGVFDAA
jgi:hypothetical protein